jgi:type II secretory pathway predicted ATPase ExeA
MLPIYCEHFNLKREPFNITPDPGFLYSSDSHKEALAQLVYGIKGRRGFVVLTGEVGTGKTTLIHCLLRELDGHTKTAMVFNMVINAKDLLRYACEKFGVFSPQEVHKEVHDYLYALEQFLIESYRNGQNAALIIDEAQNLSTEVLENVRLLSNFETASDKLLQIFLVGQPELGIRLNAPELRQLKQRIALRHHLRPLNLTECKEYICRRLEVAEGSSGLFTSEAIETIYEYAAGIPRIINILCDNGLLTAYALHKPAVEAGMVAEVARDLQLAVAPGIIAKAPESKIESETAPDTSSANFQPSKLAGKQAEHSAPFTEPHQDTLRDSARSGVTISALRARPNIVPTFKSDRLKGSTRAASGVSSHYLDYMNVVLTEAMGPMAPIILHEQVTAMGESVEEFPRRRLAELIEETTREISNESAKANCKRLMLEGMRQIEDVNRYSESERRRDAPRDRNSVS